MPRKRNRRKEIQAAKRKEAQRLERKRNPRGPARSAASPRRDMAAAIAASGLFDGPGNDGGT